MPTMDDSEIDDERAAPVSAVFPTPSPTASPTAPAIDRESVMITVAGAKQFSVLTEEDFERSKLELQSLQEAHGTDVYIQFIAQMVKASQEMEGVSEVAPEKVSPMDKLVHRLLAHELRRIARDPFLAGQFTEVINSDIHGISKLFDLIKLCDVAQLPPLERVILASAFVSSDCRKEIAAQARTIIGNEGAGGILSLFTQPPLNQAPLTTAQVTKLISNLTPIIQISPARDTQKPSGRKGFNLSRNLPPLVKNNQLLPTHSRIVPNEEDNNASQIVDDLFKRCLSQHRQSYPSSPIDFTALNLTSRVWRHSTPFARGHFADVYKGSLDNTETVVIKELRTPMYTQENDLHYRATLLRFFRELNVWGELEHPNIAQMVGFTCACGSVGLVSPWYSNGNLVQYLASHPDTSKPCLALDIVEGLLYLHTRSRPLIHGDLKGTNVLIDENGIACLGDFGISKNIEDLNRRTGFTTSGRTMGTIPWMAPELLIEDEPQLTFASDIYACAGVFLEIWSPGTYPFHYIPNEMKMLSMKIRGEIPNFQYYPELQEEEELRNLMTQCWDQVPERRPGVREVARRLYAEYKPIPQAGST